MLSHIFSKVLKRESINELLYPKNLLSSISCRCIDIFNSIASSDTQEVFIVLLLDTKFNVIDYNIIAIGNESNLNLDVQELIGYIKLSQCEKVIVAHNHPSGNVLPSSNDYDSTKILNHVLKAHRIELIDHLIITQYDSFSFREANLLNSVV